MKTALAPRSLRIELSISIVLLVLIGASPAHAFRCGNKIVIEDMHEQQVLNACGEPTSIRHLGYVLRGVGPRGSRGLSVGGSTSRYWGFNYYTEEVVVTEFIYNFGPRKFMRRLIFEGGVLVTIESSGYGYHEKRP